MIEMKRSYGARTVTLASGLLLILAGIGIGGAAPTLAADRMIVAEDMTADW